MEFKEVTKKNLKFVGITKKTTVQTVTADCNPLWKKFMEKHNEIKYSINDTEKRMKHYGVCTDANETECSFNYTAATEVKKFVDIPEGMNKIEIPESKYLVFTHKGKIEKLGETYWQIMQEIQKLGKKQKNFWIEYYDSKNWKGNFDESENEIWIAIE
jgi:AraC family transcriptional regulator